jgi:enoyl-CoA hydratase
MTRAKYYMFTCEPMSGKEAFEANWASESVPADRLEERTEELAQKIALTPTDLIMLTKRSINRQFEVMGFKTGIAASVDMLALSTFREQGLYSRKSRGVREGGDEFIERSHRDGLKAALKWREEKFGNQYRSADEAESDGTSGEESD